MGAAANAQTATADLAPTTSSSASPLSTSPLIAIPGFDTQAPLLEQLKVDRAGTIADVKVDSVLDRLKELRPELGTEDIFLTSSGSASLDVQNLGTKPSNLCMRQTNLGIIERSEEDKSTGGTRIFAGAKSGVTQVLVFDGKTQTQCLELGPLLKVYRITVSGKDLMKLFQEIRALIGDVEGLDLRIVGDRLVVDGQVLIPKDMRRVLTVVGRYQKEGQPILNLVEVSPLAMKLLAEKMEEEIAGGKDRPRDVRVRVVNNRFFLEGTVDKRVDREIAQKVCESYVTDRYQLTGQGVENSAYQAVEFKNLPECMQMVRIRQGQAREPDPIISVRVDFVTLDRSYMKSFDFRWAPGIDLQGGTQYDSDAGRFVSSFVGTLTSLFPKLNTAKTNGHARILKTVTVLVRDGEGAGSQPPEAKIEEVINVGYVIPGTATTPPTPAEKPVRTALSVKARSIPGSDKLNLGVSAQQEEIRGQAAGAPPTTLSNTVQTEIVVPNGESAALGGIVAERRSINVGRDPAELSEVKLFDLDRKHRFADDKSQFIIFVTPTKLRSTTEGTDALKRKFRLRK